MTINTDIKWFHSSNFSAPQLSNTWGCMIDVLDACLVNGFASQAISSLVVSNGLATATFPSNHLYKQYQVITISGSNDSVLNSEFKILSVTDTTLTFSTTASNQTATGTIICKLSSLGWSKPFAGTHKAVYRAKDTITNAHYLRVDNSLDPNYDTTYAKFAKVGVLETCTGVDDLSGNQFPFDPANPNKNWSSTGTGSTVVNGWSKWYYAIHDGLSTSTWFENEGATSGNRDYTLVGTKDTFFIIPKCTIGTILETPYGFFSYIHNGISKTNLISSFSYYNAATLINYRSGVSDTSLGLYSLFGYSNSYIGTTLSQIKSIFNFQYSGSFQNYIKSDLTSGYLLSPYFILDNSNFLISEIPLLRFCNNDSNSTGNLAIMSEGDYKYLTCRFRYGPGPNGFGNVFIRVL